MSTKKLIEVRPGGESLFFQYLGKVLKQHQSSYELEHRSEYSKELLKEADALMIDTSLSDQILTGVAVQPTLVRNLRCLDSFFRDDGAWYPRLLLYEALRRVFVERARDMDIRHPAFVVADAEKARYLVSVLVELGYSDIYLVNPDPEDAQKSEAFLKALHLGVRFRRIPAEELTMQAVSSTVILNGIDLSANTELLNDLSYFNFMKSTGYVLDLNLNGNVSTWLEEARSAELRVLEQSWVIQEWALLWMEKLGLEAPTKVEELGEGWLNFMKENSPSV